MRLGRHREEEYEAEDQVLEAEEEAAEEAQDEGQEIDLSKLKKRDLLEIMLKQGEEIDALRARITELESQLDERIFTLDKVGAIAEASLAVTDIFKEAEKAARIYLENIRSKVQ